MKPNRHFGFLNWVKILYVYPLECTCQNNILKTFPFDCAQGPNLSLKSREREGMRRCRIPSLSL